VCKGKGKRKTVNVPFRGVEGEKAKKKKKSALLNVRISMTGEGGKKRKNKPTPHFPSRERVTTDKKEGGGKRGEKKGFMTRPSGKCRKGDKGRKKEKREGWGKKNAFFPALRASVVTRDQWGKRGNEKREKKKKENLSSQCQRRVTQRGGGMREKKEKEKIGCFFPTYYIRPPLTMTGAAGTRKGERKKEENKKDEFTPNLVPVDSQWRKEQEKETDREEGKGKQRGEKGNAGSGLTRRPFPIRAH